MKELVIWAKNDLKKLGTDIAANKWTGRVIAAMVALVVLCILAATAKYWGPVALVVVAGIALLIYWRHESNEAQRGQEEKQRLQVESQCQQWRSQAIETTYTILLHVLRGMDKRFGFIMPQVPFDMFLSPPVVQKNALNIIKASLVKMDWAVPLSREDSRRFRQILQKRINDALASGQVVTPVYPWNAQFPLLIVRGIQDAGNAIQVSIVWNDTLESNNQLFHELKQQPPENRQQPPIDNIF